MKFDTVIIGGGLSGLICGIRLQKAGKKCAIVSAGQSAMHFSSGSFDLLGRLPDGTDVDKPLEALKSLPEDHPYSILGEEKVRKYAEEASAFLNGCGIKVDGDAAANTWRIAPCGIVYSLVIVHSVTALYRHSVFSPIVPGAIFSNVQSD